MSEQTETSKEHTCCHPRSRIGEIADAAFSPPGCIIAAILAYAAVLIWA